MVHTKHYNKLKGAITATLLLCATGALAQIYPQIPINIDMPWYSNSNPILGFNTAMLCYGTSPGYLFASAYYDGFFGESIYVNDPAIGPAMVPAGSSLYGVPDIIIGNSTGSAGSICPTCVPIRDYLMAIAYNNGVTVEIDIYDVYDDGITLAVPVLKASVSPTASCIPHTVHIDVIADSHKTGPTGLPFCDNYVVTWDDYTVASSPNVYAAYGNLNTGYISAPQQINPSGTSGYAPDVAAVCRTVGTGVDDFALIPWVNGRKLYYTEWDVTGSAPTTILMDNGSTTSGINVPRIDAWDDDRHNDPLDTYAVYKVVAQVDSAIGGTPVSVVRTYDNVMHGAGGGTDFTCSDVENITGISGYSAYDPTMTPYNSYAPTVALGIQFYYRVMHYTNYYPTTPGNDIVFVEPIRMFDPNHGHYDSLYYWVNSQSTGSPLAPARTNGYQVHATAVCAPPNDISSPDIYAWAYESSLSSWNVAYKIPAPGMFDFKQTPTGMANVAADGWKVYPSPAATMLTVSNGSSTGAATQYHITDVAGRTMLQGTLQQSTTDIDVQALAAGAYILQLYGNGEAKGRSVFVKQ